MAMIPMPTPLEELMAAILPIRPARRTSEQIRHSMAFRANSVGLTPHGLAARANPSATHYAVMSIGRLMSTPLTRRLNPTTHAAAPVAPFSPFRITKRQKAELKELGQRLAEADRDEDEGEVLHVLTCFFSHSPSDRYNHLQRALRGKLDFVADVMAEHEFCADCGELVREDHCTTVNGGDRVCEACLNDAYVYSECMDEWIHRDASVSVYTSVRQYERECPDDCATQRYAERRLCEYNGDYMTEDVYDRVAEHDDDDTSIIGDYHSSKHHLGVYYHNPRTKAVVPSWVIGIELEVEVDCEFSRTECAELAGSRLNQPHWLQMGSRYAWFERDGSLDRGFEIVTAAGPLEMHRQHMAAFLNDEGAVEGLSSHDTTTCGLHVHVDRVGLSQLTVGKVCVFVNAENNRELVTAVARREANTYSKFVDKRLADGKRMSPSRYEAVNVGAVTLEFRIFKGSLKFEAVMAAAEFARSVVLFCTTASAAELTSKAFLAWCDRPEHSDETKYLRAYLKERGYDVKSKPARQHVETTTVEAIAEPKVKDDTHLTQPAVQCELAA